MYLEQIVNRVKFVQALSGSLNQCVSTFGDQNLTVDIDEKCFFCANGTEDPNVS